MCKLFLFFLVLGFAFGSADKAKGVAVEDLPSSESAPTTSGYTFNWDFTYKYNGASAVAVDHYWVLTAKHVMVPSATIYVNGEVYTQVAAVGNAGNSITGLALIKLDKPLPGYYPLYSGILTNAEFMIVGYGFPGDVVRNESSGYFTEDRSGSRIRRWGTNKINGTSGGAGFSFTISGTNDFGGTTYEAGCNDKDSGAGVFYDDGGVWKLAGIATGRYPSGTNYSGNYAVATADSINWIKSVIADYDSDMDWLPDRYESQYAGDATSMVANVDSDGDGFSNYEEWIADTDPTKSSSYFMVDIYSNATTLAFASSSSREYRVECRHDLTDTNESWQVVPGLDWFPGADSQTVTNVTADSSNCFYRVNVKLP